MKDNIIFTYKNGSAATWSFNVEDEWELTIPIPLDALSQCYLQVLDGGNAAVATFEYIILEAEQR